MSLFTATAMLGTEGPGAGKGARLAQVERLGAAANVDEFAQSLHCSLAQGGLGLHSSLTTPSRRRDEARGIYANGAPEVGGQAPEQIVPARWNRHTLACIRPCQRGAVCFVRAPVRQSKNLPDTVAGAQTRPEYGASNQSLDQGHSARANARPGE
jgi:hypothetical protein